MAIRTTRLILALSVFVLLSEALGQQRSDERDRFAVPGGGMLVTSTHNDGATETTSVRYSGSSDWLVEQQHAKSRWRELTSLTIVEIRQTTVTRSMIEFLTSLKSVKDLEITECLYNRDALGPLEKMAWLETLSLEFSSHESSDSPEKAEVDGEFFQFLNSLKSLKHLTVLGEIDEQTFGRICSLKQMEWLSLTCRTSEASGVIVGRLPNLSSLQLAMVEHPVSMLHGLRSHSRLRYLKFETVALDRRSFECMAKMESLESLVIYGYSADSISALNGMQKLRTLYLNFNVYRDSGGFAFVQSMPSLEKLTLEGMIRSDCSFDGLKGHPKLAYLHLRCPMDAEDVAILKSLPNLRTVVVANSKDSAWFNAAKRQLPNVTVRSLGDGEELGKEETGAR